MGRTTSEKVGRGLCPEAHCGQPVTYRRSLGGMLTHKCDCCCDSSGYCEPGGTAYKARMATIQNPEPAQPAPAAPAKPDPVKAPRQAFSLGAL